MPDMLDMLEVALVLVELILAALISVGLYLSYRLLVQRGYDRWLVRYVVQTFRRRAPRHDEDVHVLLCIADHFEPKSGHASPETARARVAAWVHEYPRQFGHFRDSDGRPPRYSFFFPIEEYEPEHLDGLAELCRAGYGEVEVHLHHQDDTSEGLRDKLIAFRDMLVHRHGLLARERDSGAPVYGFIHGNWALCNSRPDGSWCGVNNELDILRQTGCYADFTFPSAPDPTQPSRINSLYYATDRPGEPRSHDDGISVGAQPPPAESLLLIQGPLLLDWQHRKWGVMPRLENGCLQGSQPPKLSRLRAWLKARVQVPARPDWFFVKLHAHGAEESSQAMLLGAPMIEFHEELARLAQTNPRFHYHYVTAREMYNLVKAAEAGWTGTVAAARDYAVLSNLTLHAPLVKLPG